ncbi:MAG: diaminohydroxyphosphoribosylaminopyrimidine deaminase [Salinivirgaceae bacterium]|nr:MAG: diaminohydroxyphosphoribosylaminopyrimidine deaminase [Salinivirgaceae bacterium]
MEKTILVTGGTGYIGAWVTKKLLEKGYIVRLAVRDKSRTDKYQYLQDISEKNEGKLELWEADLLKMGSYDAAAQGAEAIIHMASPFTLRFKDPIKDLIEPAVNGTKNVLEAANKSESVKRVVLTSSVAAVHGDTIDMTESGLSEFTEEHFNYSSSPKHQPYSYSKVAAEKAAWDIAKNQANWELVVINPSFVMGPSLSKTSDSESINFMKDMLSGKFKSGAPDLQFGFVDVRDVADAHILALENEDAEGRHILAERTAGVLDVVNIIRNEFGEKYKLPKKHAPKFVLMLMGWMFGISRKFVKNNVGYPLKLNTTKSIEKLKLKYMPLEQTLKDMVLQMEENK